MCTVKSYRYWHDALYEAGYTEALAQTSNRRLLTLSELDSADQFFWGYVFGTSSQEKISIEIDPQVFLARRVAIGRLPKTRLPAHPTHSPSGANVRQKSKNRTKNRCLKLHKRNNDCKNQKPLTQYIVEGKEVWKPYYEFGYRKTERIPTQILAGLRTRRKARVAKVKKANAKAKEGV